MYRSFLRILALIWFCLGLLLMLSIATGKLLHSPVLSFIASRDDITDIFLYDIRTKLDYNLTNTIEPEWDISWSQEQSVISYTANIKAGESSMNVYIMPRLGQAQKVDIPENRLPVGINFAADGSAIAYFSSFPRNYSDIYLSNLNERNSYNLTQTALLSEIAPHWSPNNRDLLYLRDGNLYLVNTATQTTELFLDYDTPIDLADWSPDGQKIAFYSTIPRMQRNVLKLNSITSAGTNLESYDLNAEPRSETLSWSPDSCCVVLGLVSGELAIVNFETGEINYYTGENRRFAPVWSPDGRWIAFIENRTIHLLDLYTNTAYPIPDQWRIRNLLTWMP